MPTLLSTSTRAAATFAQPLMPAAAAADDNDPSTSYKELIRHLAAQAPKPYGAIPPLLKKRRKKAKHTRPKPSEPRMGRMSHVEDWVVVDSKESLPDEEELVHPFLSTDFFTQVLPLHMPPPSLSDPHASPAAAHTLDDDEDDEDDDDDDDDEEEEEENENESDRRRTRPAMLDWKSDDDDDGDDDDDEATGTAIVRQHSISSFSKSQTPLTETTSSCVLSTSPPRDSSSDMRWVQTIAKLRRSLTVPSRKPATPSGLIPMPPAPRRPHLQRRRSEATTQPRFNPETNTYLRDTRSNPDHLRIIAAELNMIRARKLLSPLKPRGFLPRRRDPFVKGALRRESPLQHECP